MKFASGTFMAFVLMISIALTSCKTSPATSESASTDSTGVQSQPPALVTICMLPEVGVRDTQGESGKYLTTLYLSESVTLTADSAIVETAGKSYNYYKVQLQDGKQGWVRADFIAKNVAPAVFTGVTAINKRPDLASATDKNFSAMDFVATRPAKDNWIEVTGIPFGEKWFTKGYVHADNLSYDPIDISFAALYKRATGMKDLAKSRTMMDQLSANKDLQASRFYTQIFGEEGEAEGDAGPEGEGNDMDDNYGEFALDNGSYIDNLNGTTLDNSAVTPANDRGGQPNKAAAFNGSASLSGPLFNDLQVATYFLWVKSDKVQTSTILALGNTANQDMASL